MTEVECSNGMPSPRANEEAKPTNRGAPLDEEMGFHSLSFRAFAQATEDDERVAEALRFASAAKEVERQSSDGFHGNRIVILEAKLRSKREMEAFFRRLKKDEVALLLNTLEKRVDEDCTFFLRLDKQKAYLGELALTDQDDVISVKGKIKSYPKRREAALEATRDFLASLLDAH